MNEKDWPVTKNGHKKADNEKISLNVQVSKRFLADPNHRIKTTMKPIFALGKQAKKHTSCMTPLAKRIKKRWRAMLKQNKNKTLEEMMEKANNVLEHLFDCHDKCDSSWCYSKKALKEDKNIILKKVTSFI